MKAWMIFLGLISVFESQVSCAQDNPEFNCVSSRTPNRIEIRFYVTGETRPSPGTEIEGHWRTNFIGEDDQINEPAYFFDSGIFKGTVTPTSWYGGQIYLTLDGHFDDGLSKFQIYRPNGGARI